MRFLFSILFIFFVVPANAQSSDSIKAAAIIVYAQHCEGCHRDSLNSRIPSLAVLSSMTPNAVLGAMQSGKMRVQAAGLSGPQQKAVAEWITGAGITHSAMADTAFARNRYIYSNPATVYSGWGGNLQGTGYRNAAQAGIGKNNVSTLTLKWAFAIPGGTVTRSKPAVAGHWLVVGSQYGEVYAINRSTGKIGWIFTAAAAIRGAVALVKNNNRALAVFADFSTNTYAIDMATGKLVWKTRAGYEQASAVTGSVAVAGGMVYVPITSVEVSSAADANYHCCSSSGGLVALNVSNGKPVWQYRVIDKIATATGSKKNGKPFYGPSGAPVWCSPTIDEKRGTIYIGTGENYSNPPTTTSDAVQALDMRTGKLKWNFQATPGDTYNVACPFFLNCPEKPGPDLDFGMAPILTKDAKAKDILLIGQKAAIVYALNPDNGKLTWQARIGKGGALGGVHWGMATDSRYVYAPNADNALALDNSNTAIKAAPGLYALDKNTGRIQWSANHAGLSAAPAVVPGIVFTGSLDGYIRACDTDNGNTLWEYNTAQTFQTVNGIAGHGGAIDGPAPVVTDGMLFVNSGYGMFGQAKGNVLLAFEVKKSNIQHSKPNTRYSTATNKRK